MNDVSNSDLMNVLLAVKEDIGGLKAEVISNAAAFKQHLEDDKQLGAIVRKLELAGERAAGKRSAFAFVGGFVGSAITLAIDYLRHK